MRALPRACGAAVCVLALGLALGCDERVQHDIHDEINMVTRRNDDLVPAAVVRLAGYGRPAIGHIETALHTAAPPGRLRLVEALDRIGDGEAAPILRHCAVYDMVAEVRTACEGLLRRWAAGGAGRSGDPKRAEAARAALGRVAELRGHGEGPVLFGDGGIPGAVPTVGAPRMVGEPER